MVKDISKTLFAEAERGVGEGTALKREDVFEPNVVDALDGHVHKIEGDVVYAKYLLNGEEHEAAFDIAPFQKAGADFQGAQVLFLTVKTGDEETPYDLKIELKKEQTFQSIPPDVQEKLDRLEQFDNFEEIRD